MLRFELLRGFGASRGTSSGGFCNGDGPNHYFSCTITSKLLFLFTHRSQVNAALDARFEVLSLVSDDLAFDRKV